MGVRKAAHWAGGGAGLGMSPPHPTPLACPAPPPGSPPASRRAMWPSPWWSRPRWAATSPSARSGAATRWRSWSTEGTAIPCQDPHPPLFVSSTCPARSLHHPGIAANSLNRCSGVSTRVALQQVPPFQARQGDPVVPKPQDTAWQGRGRAWRQAWSPPTLATHLSCRLIAAGALLCSAQQRLERPQIAATFPIKWESSSLCCRGNFWVAAGGWHVRSSAPACLHWLSLSPPTLLQDPLCKTLPAAPLHQQPSPV